MSSISAFFANFDTTISAFFADFNTTNWIAFIAAVVGIITLIFGMATFIKSVIEYINQNALKRFEKFQEMRKRYNEDPDLQKVHKALGTNDIALVPPEAKYRFMSFYEEIALMIQSGLLQKGLAFYMFGFNLLIAWEDDRFWSNVSPKTDPYWGLFKLRCEKMQAYRDKYVDRAFPVKKFHF